MSITTFLGVGAMGEALARGFLHSGFAPSDLRLCGRDFERTQQLAQSLGATAFDSLSSAVEGAEILIVAVKPHAVESALTPLRDLISPAQTVISVAAGVSTERLEACFSADIPVVRVMPNTPALVGAGASALCGGKHATPANLALAKSLFEAVGMAVEVGEAMMDAVTGVSGSGPAYVFLFIEALADGAVRAGLPRALATQLAAQTVMGAAQMLLETGKHPGQLKDQVASPGGTTIAGIHALESGGFRGVVMDAVLASANRSKELS